MAPKIRFNTVLSASSEKEKIREKKLSKCGYEGLYVYKGPTDLLLYDCLDSNHEYKLNNGSPFSIYYPVERNIYDIYIKDKGLISVDLREMFLSGAFLYRFDVRDIPNGYDWDKDDLEFDFSSVKEPNREDNDKVIDYIKRHEVEEWDKRFSSKNLKDVKFSAVLSASSERENIEKKDLSECGYEGYYVYKGPDIKLHDFTTGEDYILKDESPFHIRYIDAQNKYVIQTSKGQHFSSIDLRDMFLSGAFLYKIDKSTLPISNVWSLDSLLFDFSSVKEPSKENNDKAIKDIIVKDRMKDLEELEYSVIINDNDEREILDNEEYNDKREVADGRGDPIEIMTKMHNEFIKTIKSNTDYSKIYNEKLQPYLKKYIEVYNDKYLSVDDYRERIELVRNKIDEININDITKRTKINLRDIKTSEKVKKSNIDVKKTKINSRNIKTNEKAKKSNIDVKKTKLNSRNIKTNKKAKKSNIDVKKTKINPRDIKTNGKAKKVI